jgi:indolepyruvate ferredoxin oxidoreductase beta subunit
MHPRVEEIADILPARLGHWLLRPHWMNALVRRLTKHGRTVTTTSLSGFLLLYMLSSRKKKRRGTLRFHNESQFLDSWLAATLDAARHDVRLACRVAQLRGLVKGYGDTHARGRAKYDAILAALRADNWTRCSPEQADSLLRTANADESDATLNDVIRTIGASTSPATAPVM